MNRGFGMEVEIMSEEGGEVERIIRVGVPALFSR